MMTQIKVASGHVFAHGVILARADALRAGKQGKPRISGYVEVDSTHFHVAMTSEGPLVSQVQWATVKDGAAAQPQHLQPMHNFFVVTAKQKTLALQAWSEKLSLESGPKKDDLEQVSGLQDQFLNPIANSGSDAGITTALASTQKVGSGRAR